VFAQAAEGSFDAYPTASIKLGLRKLGLPPCALTSFRLAPKPQQRPSAFFFLQASYSKLQEVGTSLITLEGATQSRHWHVRPSKIPRAAEKTVTEIITCWSFTSLQPSALLMLSDEPSPSNLPAQTAQCATSPIKAGCCDVAVRNRATMQAISAEQNETITPSATVRPISLWDYWSRIIIPLMKVHR
jgi:hypothetical protein